MITKIQNYNFKAKKLATYPCYAKEAAKFVAPNPIKEAIKKARLQYPENNIVIVTHNNKIICPKR